jgi:hypothetical protein
MLVLKSSKRTDVREDRGRRRVHRLVFVRAAVSELAEAMQCSDFQIIDRFVLMQPVDHVLG